MSELHASEESPVLPLPGQECAPPTNAKPKLLMPGSQHRRLMWGQEHRAALAVRASSVLLATPTTTATPLLISAAKRQDCSLETPVVFKPLQYLHHVVS